MVDPIWVGVIGGAIGSGAALLTSWTTPFIAWRVESRKLDRVESADSKRALDLRRSERIEQWREGVFEAYREAGQRTGAVSDGSVLRGRAWFESLRPHVSLSQQQVQDIDEKFPMYSAVKALADEVARIEREWKLV